jgi:hypothetical protein
VITLRSSAVEVECHPEHGFTIGSIRHPEHGPNILWNPRGTAFRRLPREQLGPAGEASIATFDDDLLAGGWFTMFPNAGPPGDERDVWMHGEAARLAWDVALHEEATLTCVLRTPDSGFAVERTVTVEGEVVTVTTAAVNTTSRPQRVNIGEHPCFARTVFAGGTLEVGPVPLVVASHADAASATLVEHSRSTWPRASTIGGGTTDLSAIPERSDGRHDHVMVSETTTVGLVGRRARVALSWDGGVLPFALLWEHFQPPGSPWDGDVLAIEPLSSRGRTTSEAAASGSMRVVPPGKRISWWMRLDLAHEASRPAM